MFQPYWLIHEPGKTHGFAIVDLDSAISEEAAVYAWRKQLRAEDPGMLASIEMHGTEVAARLITEPFVLENELCPVCGQPDNCGDCNHVSVQL